MIRDRAPSRPDIRQPAIWGLVVVLVFVVGFGGWAAMAPLSIAAVAQGKVSTDTRRQSVQHLEGGIVGRILVREGDPVAAGQPLVRLDTTQAETSCRAQRDQLVAETALAVRLAAERDGLDRVDRRRTCRSSRARTLRRAQRWPVSRPSSRCAARHSRASARYWANASAS
jgi:multidrug efflux pump subunit AcrA (membrane-fusion protein)